VDDFPAMPAIKWLGRLVIVVFGDDEAVFLTEIFLSPFMTKRPPRGPCQMVRPLESLRPVLVFFGSDLAADFLLAALARRGTALAIFLASLRASLVLGGIV
jgi:hypothetical protein